MFKKLGVLYFAQIYKAILPLIFVPLIVHALGGERYGMVSFLAMLVGWLGILDVGVGGTFMKMVATNKSSKPSFDRVCALFYRVFFLFLLISTLLVAGAFVFADFIATDWLRTGIDVQVVKRCIEIIGFVLALYYLKSYLSSFLSGMEKQHFLAAWSIVASTLQYVGSYWAILWPGDGLLNYFDVVLLVTVLDLAVIGGMLVVVILRNKRRLANPENRSLGQTDEPLQLRKVIGFSLQLSGLSVIWVVATQIDKLVLSCYVQLADYVHYQIAAQLSMLVAVLVGPLTQYLLPRLSALYKENNAHELLRLLMLFVCIFIVLLGPVPPYFFFLGKNLVSVWMHNQQLGLVINDYASWMVAAAYFSALMNFIFILLYALGRLKFHFYAYALYSAMTIPLSVLVAKYWGASASAKFIFAHSLVFMLLWGGGCTFKMIEGALPVIVLAFAVVTPVSCMTFYAFSLVSAQGTLWTLLIKVILPVVVNFVILGLLIWPGMNKLRRTLSQCSLRVA